MKEASGTALAEQFNRRRNSACRGPEVSTTKKGVCRKGCGRDMRRRDDDTDDAVGHLVTTAYLILTCAALALRQR